MKPNPKPRGKRKPAKRKPAKRLTANADSFVCNSGPYQFDLRHLRDFIDGRILYHAANELLFGYGDPVTAYATNAHSRCPAAVEAAVAFVKAAKAYVAEIDRLGATDRVSWEYRALNYRGER